MDFDTLAGFLLARLKLSGISEEALQNITHDNNLTLLIILAATFDEFAAKLYQTIRNDPANSLYCLTRFLGTIYLHAGDPEPAPRIFREKPMKYDEGVLIHQPGVLEEPLEPLFHSEEAEWRLPTGNQSLGDRLHCRNMSSEIVGLPDNQQVWEITIADDGSSR